MRPLLHAMLLAAAMLSAGCTTYSAPELRIIGASVSGRTPEGVVIDLTLDATNRNEIELPLREIRYTVSLDGREVFSGVRSPEASLRRLGMQTIHIPAVIPASTGLPSGPVPLTLEGTLGYTTPGHLAQVLFDIKVRRPTVGFRQESTVDFGTAPGA